MTNNNHTKAVRASMGDTQLMTAMISFAPVMLCAMMLLTAVR